MKYKTRPMQWLHYRENEGIFDELATTIEIVDDTEGEFVTIKNTENEGIRIEPLEWDSLKIAIDYAFREIEKYKEESPMSFPDGINYGADRHYDAKDTTSHPDTPF